MTPPATAAPKTVPRLGVAGVLLVAVPEMARQFVSAMRSDMSGTSAPVTSLVEAA